MPTVDYPVSIAYKTAPNMRGLQPATQVTLYYGARSANAVAIFDSGSIFTVFSPEYAELIGIEDVTVGNRTRINTLAGATDIYLFDLEIQLPEAGVRFAAQVGFFLARAARNILGRSVVLARAARNILGRSVVFARFEIGFHESDQRLHLRWE